MKLYAPKYYKNFRCIADKCTHNCCIGWEIDVDEDTLEKYKTLTSDYGSVIADSISMEGTPHFKLTDRDRCPHLDESGLCRIILQEGEDCLCNICREHPRFYNYTNVAEVGIGMSCPEAARIILSSPDYDVLEESGAVNTAADNLDFDGRVPRSEIYTILQDATCSYTARLGRIAGRYSVNLFDDSLWLEKLDSLEYLDAAHKPVFMQYSSERRPEEKDAYLERFLAYFIYRHCTEALDEEDFCDRLRFCLFCERLFASLICAEAAGSLREMIDLAVMISEEIEYSDDNTLALTYL